MESPEKKITIITTDGPQPTVPDEFDLCDAAKHPHTSILLSPLRVAVNRLHEIFNTIIIKTQL